MMSNPIQNVVKGGLSTGKLYVGGVKVAAGADREVSATSATLALSAALHDGRTVVLSRAAGMAVTLPASTGSGARFRVFVKTTITSPVTIAVANSSDVMSGIVEVLGSAVGAFATASTSDTITLNGTTTGGVAGTWVELEDVAPNLWAVKGALVGSGAAATPFSAAV